MNKWILVLTVILLCIATSNTLANVFAFDISISTTGVAPRVFYRLNENCSSVNVQIFGPLPGTTVVRDLAGPTSVGLNQVLWDGLDNNTTATTPGDYGFKIIATDAVGHSSWDVLSDDSGTIFQFEYPTGMAINNYNDGNLNFGMIYIANTRNLPTASGRTMTDGLYALYPDGSDPLSLGNVGLSGSVDWTLSASASPYHLFVGPDGKVWIADWSDAHPGVWRAPADLSGNFEQILDNTGQTGTGLVPGIHGSIAGVFVEGTGSGTVLYTQDEDLTSDVEPVARSIWRYDVGTGPFPWSGAPTLVVDDSTFLSFPGSAGGLLVNDLGGGLVKDSTGNIWVTNNRSAGTDVPSLIVFDSPTTFTWDSLSTGVDFLVTATPDPLRGNQKGLALDEARNRAITGGFNGFNVTPIPLPVGNLTTANTNVPWITLSGSTVATARGQVAVDAAGNVYISDNIAELLRIYSPPDGANSFTTISNITIPGGSYLVTGVQRELWRIME